PDLDVAASMQSTEDRSQYWLQDAMQHERQCESLGPTDARGTVPLLRGGASRFATRDSRLFFVPEDRAVVRMDAIVSLSVAVGADVSGTVSTMPGDPAEGAVVTAEFPGGRNVGPGNPVCRVDEKGSFLLRALPPLQTIDLWVV